MGRSRSPSSLASLSGARLILLCDSTPQIHHPPSSAAAETPLRYFPSFDDFTRLAAGHTVVPVYRQLLCDSLTPVSAFCKVQEGDWAFLFESVVGGERHGRYSFVGSAPFVRIEAYDRRVVLHPATSTVSPLALSQVMMASTFPRARRTAVESERRLCVTRELLRDGNCQYDSYLAHADAVDVALMERARVAKAEHRMVEGIKRGKSEAEMADDHVRKGVGWHHHIALFLVAMWFLIWEARRGKTGPRVDHSATPRPDREPVGGPARVQPASERSTPSEPLVSTKRTGTLLPRSQA